MVFPLIGIGALRSSSTRGYSISAAAIKTGLSAAAIKTASSTPNPTIIVSGRFGLFSYLGGAGGCNPLQDRDGVAL